VELGLFGALWSEHCGYKHSRPLLKGFPTTGEAVRVAAGEENAGVVEIGDGLSVVFKVESHNHPSAVEPYQGAATGVGGIVRDILAMGARPIALLNSLRFGTLDDPRNRFLFEGVVAGISGYGNCIGVPDVGGEVVFDASYAGNPLVNAMCVGLLREGEMMTAAARIPGNTLMLVGAATGRDGIHGASGLASRAFEEEREMRPTVQVGDPFMEKVLIEACLEAARSGHLEGMQDLGAAGLTSSVMESVAKGGMGLDMDVAKVPRRETGMTPYEVMLSESQERMLLIVTRGHEGQVRQMFEKWDLQAAGIGTVVEGGIARVYDGDILMAQASVETLTEAPQYRLKGKRPAYLDGLHNQPLPSAPSVEQAGAILLQVLAAPNIASKHSIYRQYDHEVQTNTVVKPGQADAAVMRLRGSSKGIAVSLDGDGRKTYLEPYIGGALAVAEACRNVACTGAKPLAITDCLNFGNPEKPEVYYQLEECIKGMTAACIALGVPVISGNVSLYNESQGKPIYPTPVVGALGVLEDVQRYATAGFKNDGDVVLLLGADVLDAPPAALVGSEYLDYVHGVVAGRPDIDLQAERRLQEALVSLIRQGLLNSAHDCSGGGMGVTIAESCILGNVGFQGGTALPARWDAALFGEGPSRVVVSLSSERDAEVELVSQELGVPFVRLGIVGGTRFTLPGLLDLPLADLADAHGNGLERAAGA
jgi:phosphoribosylformylglycinamidine synthase